MVIKVETMLKEIGITLDPEMLEILDILQKQKKVAEEQIAKKLKMHVNDVRKLIYRLYEKGLAIYEKKTDPKKKWWYVYYWSLNKDKIADLYLAYRKKYLEKKKVELQEEQKYAFVCKTCNARYDYESALDKEFTCPVCSAVLEEIKDSQIVKKLKQDIARLEKEIKNAEERRSKEKKNSK